MARRRAYEVTVGVQQSAMSRSQKLVTVKMGDDATHHFEVDQAIQFAKRLTAMVNMVSTTNQRKNAR